VNGGNAVAAVEAFSEALAAANSDNAVA